MRRNWIAPNIARMARKLANESMVLLKNDGLLPLKPGIKNIVVVGPLADQTRPLIGNYAGQPTHIVSILDGLHAEFPNAAITFVAGTQFLRTDGTPVPDSLLTTPDGKPGLKADYNEGMRRGATGPWNQHHADHQPHRAQRQSNRQKPAAGDCRQKNLRRAMVRIPHANRFGRLPPRYSRRGFRKAYRRRQAGSNGVRWRRRRNLIGVGRVHLEKGRKVALEISYGSRDGKPMRN
jgi:beta-glucosidase